MLQASLPALAFCDEIILVDLMSTDETLAIARPLVSDIYHHEPCPIVEHIYPNFIPLAKHDWIILTDPDEVIDPTLAADIAACLDNLPPEIASVRVPIRYYYCNRPLRGTVWGPAQGDARLLFHRQRIHIRAEVHAGIELREGYTSWSLPFTGLNVIHHYWMRDFPQLVEKHRRYIGLEGRKLAERGAHYTLLNHLKKTILAFLQSFFHDKGYRDGLTGLLLSAFWAWYTSAKLLALKRIQAAADEES